MPLMAHLRRPLSCDWHRAQAQITPARQGKTLVLEKCTYSFLIVNPSFPHGDAVFGFGLETKAENKCDQHLTTLLYIAIPKNC